MKIILVLTGTSTGGILAAAIGILGKNGRECFKLYEGFIPYVFGESKLLAPNKYDESKLESLVRGHFVSFSLLRLSPKETDLSETIHSCGLLVRASDQRSFSTLRVFSTPPLQ